jgi:hypothetical protein
MSNHKMEYRWHNPKRFDRLNYESKGENNERIRSWGALPGFHHFGGKKVCWSSEMGTTKNDKRVNYSHRPTHTKQKVG